MVSFFSFLHGFVGFEIALESQDLTYSACSGVPEWGIEHFRPAGEIAGVAVMNKSSPSKTAEGVAWLRAAHQVVDQAPLILDDPVIVPLLGPETAQRLRADPARVQSPGGRVLRSHVVLRSRFTEDRLKEAIARGVSQYVILGAGYDTFFARQPNWARALRVVEVDVAATQSEKLARLEAARIAVPANVVLVGFDFREGTLIDALRRHGVTTEVPTFFSWLGVTMYLTATAIDATLGAIAQFPTGSEVVLTFAPREPADSPGILATLAAAAGEPWLSYFEPVELEQKLAAFGLNQVEFLTPEEATRLYYQTRTDGLPPPRRTLIVSAQRKTKERSDGVMS